MAQPTMTQSPARRLCHLVVIALTFLIVLAACGREAPEPNAARIASAPGTATPIVSGRAAPASTPAPPAATIVLADGSFLNFRGGISKKIDHTPLKDVEVIRVLVNYTRTTFFVSQNQPRGFEYEYMREFERFLNQRLQRTRNPIRFEFVVTDFDRVLPDLIEGRGDIAAAHLTITPSREEKIDFSLPYLTEIDEVVVTNRNAPPLASLDALAGKRVLVVRGSSYTEHLRHLAEEQKQAGRVPVQIVEAEASFESEDILEMVNAGIVDYTVVDSHGARLWAEVLPNIVVLDNVVVNRKGSIAWATRPESHELREALDEFVRQNGARGDLNRTLFQRYFRDTRWIRNPALPPNLRRQASMIDHVKRQSAASGLDWRLVMAHAAAQSGFDQTHRGPDGAIGIMQVTPSMAAAVGVSGIEKPEQNIRAGVRYLAKMRDDFAREGAADKDASLDLALAAYRVGPDQVRTLQKYAAELGLDPNLWERNVELVSDLTLGEEPARQVKEVHQYHSAYRLNGVKPPQKPVRP